MNVVTLLQQLIQIPSVNPDNDPGTDLTGEQKIADFLTPLLQEWGFTVTQDEILKDRPNLIARCPGSEERPRILLGPHLDTVGVGGMSISPFSGDIKNDRIWGRGSSDTKGPMAAMLMALFETKHLLERLPIAVDFIAFMGEESSQFGSIDFAKKYAHEYSFALVGEPTSLDIVYTNKGSLWATLQATGRAAHSSRPELGENAILKLSRSLDHLNRKLTGRLATYTHDKLGHATLNIGTFHGGTRPNIVPDLAKAEIDIRTTPPLDDEGGALPLLEKEIETAGLPVEIVKANENPSMETDVNNAFVQKILTANPFSKVVGAPWFSDAAHLSKGGIPSVCAGPGSIDQAHTKDEFISIADLEAGVGFYKAFIEGL